VADHQGALRFGVIGLGHWGPNIVRNIGANRRAVVVAVCDVSTENLQKVSPFVSATCRLESDYSQILVADDIDAVAIVTNAASHASLVAEALKRGKHVLCEKPLGFDAATLLELGRLAVDNGVKLMVGYTFLYNTGVAELKKIVDEGRLGQIYYLDATRTHLGLIRNDVDAMWDLAPHDVAIMNYILGETPFKVSVASTSPLNGSRCDVAFVNLYYSSGVIGHIHVSWLAATKVRVIQIAGSQGRALFDDLDSREPIRVFHKGIDTAGTVEADFGNFRYLITDGDIVSPKVTMTEPLKAEVEAFIGHVLDGSHNPTDYRFAAAVSGTLAAATRSIALGGTPVLVE
jgi:predicted dehydrogenase